MQKYSRAVRITFNTILSEEDCRFEWPHFIDYLCKRLPQYPKEQVDEWLLDYWNDPLAKWHW
jgi:hypothetical protein